MQQSHGHESPGEAPGLVTEVHIDAPLARPSVMVVCAIAVFVAGDVAWIAVGRGQGVVFKSVATGVAGFCAVSLGIHITARKARHAVDELLATDDGGELSQLVRAVLRRSGETGYGAGLEEFTRQLAARRRTGIAIRLATASPTCLTEPLTIPFEPCPLDEVETALQELCGSSTAPGPHSTVPGAPAPNGRALRRLKRNMRARGVGWFLVAAFVVNTIVAAIEAVANQTVNWRLLYCPAMLAVLLFMPAGGSLFRVKQWYAVPAGVILRKAHVLAPKWKVHLFERRASVICVYPIRTQQGAFAVADANACETGVGTRTEIDFLLRAWLSPLRPPEAERLTDLQ